MKRADALIQYLKVTSAETPYLIRESEEITLTHEQEVTFINSSITSERSVMLIATIDGKHMASVPVVMDGIVAEGLSKGIYVVKLIGNMVCLSRKVVMDE